jgi:hypothetical protein
MLTFEKKLKITQMISCEGEVIDPNRTFYSEGNVELYRLEVGAVIKEHFRIMQVNRSHNI